MDALYTIIKQLSDEEFLDIYQNLTSNKAEKSALFLKTIRESDNPVEDFLEKQEISASAFYVLKSRLNQKVEDFLLNRLGDPKMEAIQKVFKVYDLIFQSPREIAVTTLKRLEKTMLDEDNSLVLMVVYRALKMLHSHDDNHRVEYDQKYNQAVAFYLANDKAMETVMTFFRIYDRYYLARRERDYNELIRTVEKIHNQNNLYTSQRLFISMAIIHLFSSQFVELPDRMSVIMESDNELFEKSFEILEKNPDDILFKNLNLIFDFLRYTYYRRNGDRDREQIYFELLDYKIEDLLKGFNFGMDCSSILFFKLLRHQEYGTLDLLQQDIAEYIDKIEIDSYRLVTYINFNLFKAYASFYKKDFENSSRILYRVRNEVSLRKNPHVDVEVKMFLALSYVLLGESDLANQLILSLQRQLKKSTFSNYENGRIFLKILTNRQGGRTTKKLQQLKKLLEEFEESNKGTNAILPYLKLSFETFTEGM
ncbi:MAG: hypothetical protein H6581_15540 [Bacteroidia bacterium]|nr:hypothetical protein [Bacteroidia bacterium]